MKENLIERKSSLRLKGFNYTGNYAYLVTCCTNKKKHYFQSKNITESMIKVLKETSSQFSFNVYAYCFMPDHLHILIIGSENSSLHGFMKIFKQKSSFFFKKFSKDILWQRSYHDHVLRKEEALIDIALYIFNNPVRKGLVRDYKDYPYLGSFIFGGEELIGQT